MYISVVTLLSKDNVIKLAKLLEEGFKRSVYWNECQTIETRDLDDNNLTRFPLDVSFQGVRKLFVLAFDNSNNGTKKVGRNNHRKYFLSRVNITNYNVVIDGRNVYDQPINSLIK